MHPYVGLEKMVELIEGPPLPWPAGWEDWEVTRAAHAASSECFLARLPDYPEGR